MPWRGYSRPLKVSTSEGRQIIANIRRIGENVIIEVSEYIEEVKKDDPPFAKNGFIRFSCKYEKYRETIEILTKYLEDLFLKGMVNEDIYTGLGAKSKPRKIEEDDFPREIRISKGEGDTPSVPSGARGNKSSEGSGGGATRAKVAKVNDTPTVPKDKRGD